MTLDPRHPSNISKEQDPQTPDPNEFSFVVDEYNQDDASSVITIDDDLSNSHLSADPIYGLPTHISSHGEEVYTTSRTQPSTPVSTPYREQPNHPLRALTSTHLVLNQQLGTDESLLSNSPIMNSGLRHAIEESSEDELGEEDEKEIGDEGSLDDDESLDEEALIISQRQRQHKNDEWNEKGAATLVKRTRNSISGEEEDIIIKKSVKDFKFGKTLGVGSYSTVLLATDKNTQKQFAVKVLDKRHIIREKKVKYVNIEKNTLNRLGKKNGIIHLFFTFQDESSLYFVLDYASGGELLNLIKEHGSLNEECVKYYGAQILDAIKYMHDNGVVHRDLKPENILLDESLRVQITDFGTAKLLEKNENGNYPADTKAKSFVGTAEYVCPELLNEKAIGKNCDIWAFGCILYQMIAGKPPFKATNEYLTFQKIVKLQYAFTAGFPMVVRDLVKKILKLNPQDRLSIKEIQNHHFFNGIDFSNPDESIWGPEPPTLGPYKVSAKSMLPVPELATGQKTRITVNIPRRVVSTPSTPKSETVTDESDESSSYSQVASTPTASQQVLMKAKATIAARKQQQLKKQDDPIAIRVSSAGSAANAASIALSRQPNDIIKAWNVSKESRKDQDDLTITQNSPSTTPTPPLSASSNLTEKRSHSRSAPLISTLRKKPPPSKPVEVQPMSKLDLEFVDYLETHDERVLKKNSLNVQLTTVDLIEKKYKGRLVDAPLGGFKSSSSSLLSQVANGSYKGLRNMSQHGQEHEKHIITNHSFDEDIDKIDSAKTKFRKFFSNSSTGEDDKRNRVVIVTNNGRLLIFNQNVDTNEYELRTEINLTYPVVRVKELVQTSTSANVRGLFVVESYNTAFTFEDKQTSISSWTQAIHKARSQANDKAVQKELEKDPGGSAGTVLGSEAAKSAANIATIQSPPLRPVEPSKRTTTDPLKLSSTTATDTTTSKKTLNQQPSSHMLKDLVRSRGTSGTRSSSNHKELPGNGQLFHGLPIKLIEQSATKDQSRDPLIAAAEAALSHQSSSFNGTTTITSRSSFNESSSQPKVITGMNSRLLARSHDRRKKK